MAAVWLLQILMQQAAQLKAENDFSVFVFSTGSGCAFVSPIRLENLLQLAISK